MKYRNSVRIFLSSLFIFLCSAVLPAVELKWNKALSGQIIAGPLMYEDRIYVASADRMITCLSEMGRFLWSRRLPGKPSRLLTVTSSGFVYALSEPGIFTAFNADGSLLWQLHGQTMPSFSPYEGRDGRIFLVYAQKVVCVSLVGAVKWTLSINSPPIMNLSETGDGELLLACKNNVLLRISPFGSILETMLTPETASTISSMESGFAIGYPSGLIQVYDVRNGRVTANRKETELLWQFKGGSPCEILVTGKGTLLSIHSSGMLYGLNRTDGSLLWKSSLKYPIVDTVFATYDYDQFNIAYTGYSCAWTILGRHVWEHELEKKLISPIISNSGILYASTSDWIIYAYQAETRIKTEKKTQKRQNYSILNGSSTEYTLPITSDPAQIQSFFDRVKENIANGTTSTNEVFYARRLTEILRNERGLFSSYREYEVTERSQAASILGQLGSSEYRDVLLISAYDGFDPTMAIGILYGIASNGYDPDGESLHAIQHIMKEAGSRETGILYASCDALYAIIRYSSGKIALEGSEMLIEIVNGSYDEQVRKYAQHIIGTILR